MSVINVSKVWDAPGEVLRHPKSRKSKIPLSKGHDFQKFRPKFGETQLWKKIIWKKIYQNSGKIDQKLGKSLSLSLKGSILGSDQPRARVSQVLLRYCDGMDAREYLAPIS